jgi:hypothetical protein
MCGHREIEPYSLYRPSPRPSAAAAMTASVRLAAGRRRRGVFTSVADLKAAIRDYLDHHNANPKPFVWTKTAAVVLAKERRALDALEAVKNGCQPSDSDH